MHKLFDYKSNKLFALESDKKIKASPTYLSSNHKLKWAMGKKEH